MHDIRFQGVRKIRGDGYILYSSMCQQGNSRGKGASKLEINLQKELRFTQVDLKKRVVSESEGKKWAAARGLL